MHFVMKREKTTMKKQPIGFMDSGVGGLTLGKARKHLPNENMVFIGDQARLPYGNRLPYNTRILLGRWLISYAIKRD